MRPPAARGAAPVGAIAAQHTGPDTGREAGTATEVTAGQDAGPKWPPNRTPGRR